MKNLVNLKSKFQSIYKSGADWKLLIIGLLIAVGGIVFGAWLGLWVMLVGSIMDIVEVVNGTAGSGKVLVAILKFTFSWIGWLFVWAGIAIGGAVAGK